MAIFRGSQPTPGRGFAAWGGLGRGSTGGASRFGTAGARTTGLAKGRPLPAALGAHDASQTTTALVRGLMIAGCRRGEAGNIVGLVYGLRPVRGGWTVREIEHLRFLRALAEGGRLGGDA